MDNDRLEELHDCVERVFSVCLYCDDKADCINVGDLLCQAGQITRKQLRLNLIATDSASFTRN